MSLISLSLMLLLFASEFFAFMTTDITTDIALDTNDAQTVRINFNVTFHDLHCDYLAVDVLDSLGTNRQNVTKNVEKWQIDETGRRRIFSGRNKEVREVRHEDHEKTLEEMHEDGVHAVVVDKESFDGFLAENDLAFVNFYAPWCIWCQRLHPTWEAFAEKVQEEEMPVGVGQVDCVANSELCGQQKIAAFPTLRWFVRQEAVMPDYKQDRTVNTLHSFAARKLQTEEKYKDWEQEHKKALATKKKPPPPPPTGGRPEHQGCQVSGYLMVNRVPGNFHIEARSVNHNLNAAMTNLSHTVNSLSFGEPPNRQTRRVKNALKKIPPEHKQFEPMNGMDFVTDKFHTAAHHYINVVSTHFAGDVMKYQVLSEHQTVSYEEDEVPEARFSYDISPMSVTVNRRGRKTWYEFVTSAFAIVGGTFTTLGLIDGALYKVMKGGKVH